LQPLFGLQHALQAYLSSQHRHGFKERWRVFASADSDADGLKGLPGLETEFIRGRAQSCVERIVIEIRCRQHLLCGFEHAYGHRRIALLRNQFGGIVGRELRQKEEIGGGDGFAQQLDALADERRDGGDLFRRGMIAFLLEDGLQFAGKRAEIRGPNIAMVSNLSRDGNLKPVGYACWWSRAR